MNYFEYWDAGDRVWKRRHDEKLESGESVSIWFKCIGIRVRKAR